VALLLHGAHSLAARPWRQVARGAGARAAAGVCWDRREAWLLVRPMPAMPMPLSLQLSMPLWSWLARTAFVLAFRLSGDELEARPVLRARARPPRPR
jgi:hypothetical protein